MSSELLLLSGGIDSIAIAAWRRPAVCMTIDYGQKPASAEVQAAARVCAELGLYHEVLRIPLGGVGSGQMAGEVQSPHSAHAEFWPFRNQFLITVAGMLAMKMLCNKILIGTVVSDRRHADGSPKFLSGLSDLLALQEGAIELMAPASELSSKALVDISGINLSLLSWAHSCHTASMACGHCPGCIKHSEVMQQLGIGR
jgi:7-cyano-7-deazaguanine synthase